jgi:crossover junction endodeoxyribonuclease RusA
VTFRKTSQAPAAVPRGAGDAARAPRAATLAGAAPMALASQASPLSGAPEGDAPGGGAVSPGVRPEQGSCRTPGSNPRIWRIELPPGMDLLNSNQRAGHWGHRQRLTLHLRAAAGWKAMQQQIPQLQRAHVLGIYEPPDLRKRDPANLYPSFKACIDGIVSDAGVLVNDDAEHLDGPDMRLGPVHPRGRLVLVITELGGET